MQNQLLQQAGLKVTGPRTKILQLLEQNSKKHLSAEDIYQLLYNSGESIPLATIYRVLTQFEQASLVIRHNFNNDCAVFELNEGEHHDHLVCVRCGRVEEFVDEVIDAHQCRIAERAGFELLDHRLDLYGICQNCQSSQR